MSPLLAHALSDQEACESGQTPTSASETNPVPGGSRLSAERLLLLVLVLLAFISRAMPLTIQSLWRDEVDALMFATRPLPELLSMFGDPGQNGPLFFLALRPWLAMAGPSEFSLRFPSALAGTLAVPVTYVLVRRLAGRHPAALAALTSAVAPYLVWYGQDAKMYAVLTVLVPASLWLCCEAGLRGGRRTWILLYAMTSLAFYTHLLAALVVPVQVLWLLILAAGRRRLAVLAYLAALLLPYLPLVTWQASAWLSPTFQTGHPFVSLPDMLTVLAVAFSRGVLPVTQVLTLLPYMLALAAGVMLWARRRRSPLLRAISDKRVVALLGIWLLLPPLALYGVSLGMPIFTDRYVIWAMPAYLALGALGVEALTRAWRPLGYATLVTILALDLAGVAEQARRPIKSDFRAAAAYVMANRAPADLLIYQIPYIRHTFAYYSSGQQDPLDTSLPWYDGLYTNAGMGETEAAERMARAVEGHDAVWLIASEVPMWDARGLTQGWLESHGSPALRAEYARVVVTRYVLDAP